MLASLRFLVRSKRLFLSLNASVRTRTGRFCVPVITKRKESRMRWFAFLFSTRFWIAVWILVLFVGLLPLPPAAELVILVGFLSHTVWFVWGRLRRAAQRRSLARAEKAEDEEFRRQRRRRPLPGDASVPPVRGDLTWH